MGRIRSIKPELFRSRELAGVSVEARWTFIGIWCAADDEGRYEDEAALIKADVYPRDPDISTEAVGKHLDELASAGVICRYTADVQRCLHVPGFRDEASPFKQSPQKRQPPVFPACGRDHSANGQGTLWAADGSTTVPVPPVGEGSRRVEERRGDGGDTATAGRRPAALSDDFKPTADDLTWAKTNHPAVDAARETQKFVLHYTATGKPMKRWGQAWRNWIIKAEEYGTGRQQPDDGPRERSPW